MKRPVYNQGTGTCNVTEFLGCKWAGKAQEYQELLEEWISWGKTSSDVAKLLSATGELGSLPETSSVGCSSEGSANSVEAGGEGDSAPHYQSNPPVV